MGDDLSSRLGLAGVSCEMAVPTGPGEGAAPVDTAIGINERVIKNDDLFGNE